MGSDSPHNGKPQGNTLANEQGEQSCSDTDGAAEQPTEDEHTDFDHHSNLANRSSSNPM